MSKTVIGLWLDHKDAVLASFTGYEHTIYRLHSKLRRRSKSTGGSRKALPYSFDGGGAYKKIEHKRENLIREYFVDISKALTNADQFLVMGPGEAKKEFSKFFSQKKSLKNKLVAITDSDYLTERQIAAKTRDFFNLKSKQ